MLRSLNGKTPQVHPTAYVSEAAYVVGDVEIGPHSSVWPGAVVRGDGGKITIGSHSNVQDNSVVHADADATLGDYVTVGHGVVCHAGRVEDYVLLGNGCVVNDGAVIGHHSIVAAAAMVLERKEIPPHSVAAGVPAEVRGRTLKRHLTLIEQAAASYAERAERYKAAGLE